MTTPHFGRRRLPTLVLGMAVAFTLLGQPALGQTTDTQTDGGRRRPGAISEARSDAPDFLFGRPDGWVGVRTGWLFARAGSDWFDFVTDQLTIDDGAFNTTALAVDYGITVAPRLDAVVGLDFNRARVASEYRRFVDNDRLPINQDTRLTTITVTGGAKIALRSRGRDVSRLAWVPNRVVPFVGAGGGALRYALEQSGDFIDFRDSSVFPSTFRSEAWTPSAHVFGGVDLQVLRRTMVTIDGRYRWASGPLSSTWVDFDPIDLSGFTLSAGMHLMF